MPTPRAGESKSDFLERCIPMTLDDGAAKDNDQAVAMCNGVWEQEQQEAETMPVADVGQIAKSAIEVALSVVKGSGEITPERAEKLLYALEADLTEIWQPGAKAAIGDIIDKRETAQEMSDVMIQAENEVLLETLADIEPDRERQRQRHRAGRTGSRSAGR
jgi:hypothetical protein